jgi:hypothetical protein
MDATISINATTLVVRFSNGNAVSSHQKLYEAYQKGSMLLYRGFSLRAALYAAFTNEVHSG